MRMDVTGDRDSKEGMLGKWLGWPYYEGVSYSSCVMVTLLALDNTPAMNAGNTCQGADLKQADTHK